MHGGNMVPLARAPYARLLAPWWGLEEGWATQEAVRGCCRDHPGGSMREYWAPFALGLPWWWGRWAR